MTTEITILATLSKLSPEDFFETCPWPDTWTALDEQAALFCNTPSALLSLERKLDDPYYEPTSLEKWVWKHIDRYPTTFVPEGCDERTRDVTADQQRIFDLNRGQFTLVSAIGSRRA